MQVAEPVLEPGRLFRASPAYELVPFDRLTTEERAPLAELAADRSFYGVLRPSGDDARSVRAVDRDTALLLLTLREPGPLPTYVGLEEGAATGIGALVMDGVLEVADGERFVSGAAAAHLLLPAGAHAAPGDPVSRVARLSVDALHWAAALPVDDRHALAGRLYGYGRIPVSPAWARRLPGRDAVLRFLRAGDGGAGAFSATPAERGDAWIQFSRRTGPPSRRAGPGSGHKLYVSPLPESLPDAFTVTVDVLARTPVRHFKVGADAAGVLRPDRMVVYFEDAAVLAEVGQALGKRLAGIAPHGVPFTADLAGDGLLSWGVDPPAEARPVSWLPTESWRWWIARRLAAALIEARRANGGAAMSPARFALERLRLEGVDVDRWMPAARPHRRAAV